MPDVCKKIQYKKRSNKPVVRVKKLLKQTHSGSSCSETNFRSVFYAGEGEYEELPHADSTTKGPKKGTLQSLREWVQKQRFLPQDLSDEFLLLFLSAAGYIVESATDKMLKYFYSRQEPSPLFRNRDPLSREFTEIFKKLYVLPMPDTTDNGSKIILTGLVDTTNKYDPMEHAKALAMIFDLLIWEKDFGFGDFVVILDGRKFQCPQLLANQVCNHRSITSLLLGTIPGTLRSFIMLYPPPYVKHVAQSRDGIWFKIARSKQEIIKHFPRDILPVEYGGNLGHLGDLLEQWQLHLAQSRDFFINFEKKMIIDYCRRLCHEKEVAEGGKNWIYRMKLEADEWEYKMKYYQRIKDFKLLKHPAFGSSRLLHRPKTKTWKDPMARCRKLVKEEEEKEKIFEPTYLYHGYAKEIRQAKLQAEMEKLSRCEPILELHMADTEGEANDALQLLPKEAASESAPLTVEEEEEEEGGGGDFMWEEEEGELVEKSESEPEIDFHEELIEINSWLEREPYLPKNIDEEVLITFLWDSESVEEAEAKLMNYFYARQSVMPVFHDRHPCSPNNLLKYDAVCVVPLTSGLDKKWIIFATWLSHEDPAKFSMYHLAKLIFTELDILLQENQIRGKTISIIIDMKGYSEEHTAKITKFAAKKICYLFTDCFPARFNGFYIINPPDHVADYTKLFGPFDFHLVEFIEDLPGFLPKKFLPSDMAGEPDAKTRDSLFEPFFKRMRRCGNWLAYEEFVRSQEMLLRMTTTREEFSFGIIKAK